MENDDANMCFVGEARMKKRFQKPAKCSWGWYRRRMFRVLSVLDVFMSPYFEISGVAELSGTV